jgi:hypothetical protein
MLGCQPSKYSLVKTSLVKIQISGAFWFKDDLSFINKLQQNILGQKIRSKKKDNNSNKDKKMTTNSFARVSKMHIENTMGIRLITKNFFLGNRGTKRLKAIDTMLGDTKKYIRDVACTRVKIYYIYFQTRGCWEAW